MRYGIKCPSCGGTRCLRSLASGDIVSAFNYNPYILLVVMYLIAIIVLLNLGKLFGFEFANRVLKILANYRSIIAIVIGFAVFGIVRIFI